MIFFVCLQSLTLIEYGDRININKLLSSGAKCEANTFDGERCLYAAINDHIRKLLKTYKAITPECMRRDSYREWLRR